MDVGDRSATTQFLIDWLETQNAFTSDSAVGHRVVGCHDTGRHERRGSREDRQYAGAGWLVDGVHHDYQFRG